MADIFKDVANKLKDFFNKMNVVKRGFQSIPKRFAYMRTGFQEAGNGIGSMFENIGNSFKIGSISISGLFEAVGEFLEFNAKCFAYFMENIDTCFLFYLVDFLGRVLYLIVPMFIYLFRITTGIDIKNQIDQAFELIRFMDNNFYSFSGFYLTRYPESVRDKCYKCHYGGKVQTVSSGISNIKHKSRMVDYTFNESSGTGDDTIPRLMKKMNSSFAKSKRYFEAAFSSSGELPDGGGEALAGVQVLPPEYINETIVLDSGAQTLDDIQNQLNAQATDATNIADPNTNDAAAAATATA